MEEYDIAVVGLGPAGAVFSQYVSPRYRVLALDKKAEEGEDGFVKPCGGLLAPDAQKALSCFGLTLPSGVLADPQIFSVRTLDFDSGLERYYPRHYINIDRLKFDRWLISLVPQTVDVRKEARCTGLTRADGGFDLTYTVKNKTYSAHAKYVVGADGAASKVRAALFGGFKIEKLLALQQSFSCDAAEPSYCCFFDSKLTPGYAWGLTKDGKFIMGGAFGFKDAVKNFETLKVKLTDRGLDLREPLSRQSCLVLRPRGGRVCLGGEGAFLIGEAAGLISPSSLEGISYALKSGRALAESLDCKSPLWSYMRAMKPLRRKLRLKGCKRAVLQSPFLRKLIMKSGLSAIKVTPRR